MIATQHKCRCGVPTFYYDELSPQSRSCYMLIKVLDIDVKLQLIDLINGEHLSEAYSKINPSCTVPAWIEGDLILSDGHTILIYVCDKYAGVYLPNLCPRDYLPRLNVLNMLFYEGCVLYRRHMHVLTEILLEKYPNVDLKYHQRKLTIADFSIITTVSGLDLMFPICQDYWPNLHRWVGNLKEMECYKYNEEGIEQMRHLLESVGEFPFPSQLTLEPRAALRSSFQPGVYIDQNNMDTPNLKNDADVSQSQPESLFDSTKTENDKDLTQTKQNALKDLSDKDLSKSNKDGVKDLPQSKENGKRDPSMLDDVKEKTRSISETVLEPTKLVADKELPHTETNPLKDSSKLEDVKDLPHTKTESLLDFPKLKDIKNVSQTKDNNVLKRKEKHESPVIKNYTSRNSQVSNSGRNSLLRNKEPTREKMSEQLRKCPQKPKIGETNCQKSKGQKNFKQVCQKPLYNNLSNQLVEDCCQRSSILKKPRADCLCCDCDQSKEDEMPKNVDQRTTLTVECCQIDQSQKDNTVDSQRNSTQDTNHQDAEKVKCVEFECRILETDNIPQDCEYKDQCPCCYASLQRNIGADNCSNAFAEGELRKCASCLCIQNCDGCDQSCPCSKITSRRDVTSCDEVDTTCAEESSSCDMETSCQIKQDCECLEQKCDEDNTNNNYDNDKCICDEEDSRDNLICCCDVSNDNLHHTSYRREEDNAEDLYCRCNQEDFVDASQINDQFCCCDDQQQIDNDISVEVDGPCGKAMKKHMTVEEILDNSSNIVLCLCDGNRSKPVKICYASNAPNTSYDTVTYCCQTSEDTGVSETCSVDDCSCYEAADKQDAADICQESESCECCDDGITVESDDTLTCCCNAKGNEKSQPKEMTLNCCCSHADNSLLVCSCDTKRKGTTCHFKELYEPTITSNDCQCCHCKPDLNSMEVEDISCESYENECQKCCGNRNTTSNAKYCKKSFPQENSCTCYDERSNREREKRDLRRCEPHRQNRKMHSCPPKVCDTANWEIPQARYIDCCDSDHCNRQKSWADEVQSYCCVQIEQNAKDSKCNKEKKEKTDYRSQFGNTNGKEKVKQSQYKASNDKAAFSNAAERDEKNKSSNRNTNQTRTSPTKLITSARDKKSNASEAKDDVPDKTAGRKTYHKDSRDKSKMVEDKNINAKTSGKKVDKPEPMEEMDDSIVENVDAAMQDEEELNDNSIDDETPVVSKPIPHNVTPRSADKQRISQEAAHKRAGSGGRSSAEKSKGNLERHSRTVVCHISDSHLDPNCKHCSEQKCKFVHQSRRPSPSPRGRTNNCSANQKSLCEAGNSKTLRKPVIQTTSCANGHISRSACPNNHKREACTSKQSTCKTNRLRAGSSDRNSRSREQSSPDKERDESLNRNIPNILDRILQDKKKLERQQRTLTSMDFQDSLSDVSHEEITNINHLYTCDDDETENLKILETQKHGMKSKIPRLVLPKIYQVYRESHEISTSRKQLDELKKHPQKFSAKRELHKGRPESTTTRQGQHNSECCKCLMEHCCGYKKTRIPQPSRTRTAKNSKGSQGPRLSYELVAYDPKSNTEEGSLTCVVCHKYLPKSASGQVVGSRAELLDSEEGLQTRSAHSSKSSGKVQETINITQVKHCNSSGCLFKNVAQVTAKTNRRVTSNSPQGSENSLGFLGKVEKPTDRQTQAHIPEENHQGNYGPRGLCLYCQRNAERQANRERRHLTLTNPKSEEKDRRRGCSAVRTESSNTVCPPKRTAGVADESLNHVLKSLAAACIKCVKDTDKVKCQHKTERQTMTEFSSSSIGNNSQNHTTEDKTMRAIAICKEFQDSDSDPSFSLGNKPQYHTTQAICKELQDSDSDPQNERTCKPNELYCYPTGQRDSGSPNIPTSNFILQETECKSKRIRGGLTDNLGREKKVKSDSDVRIHGCSCKATIPTTVLKNCGRRQIMPRANKGGFKNNGKCCCNMRVDSDNRSHHEQSPPTQGSKSYSESFIVESSECQGNSVPVEMRVLVTECCEEKQECKCCRDTCCCQEKDAKETTNEQRESSTENLEETEITKTKPKNNKKGIEEKEKQASGSKNTERPNRSSTSPNKDPSVERKTSAGKTFKKDSAAAKTSDTPIGSPKETKTDTKTKTKESQKEMERRKKVDSQNATERKAKQMKSTTDSSTTAQGHDDDSAHDLNTSVTVVDKQSENYPKEVICCQEPTRCSKVSEQETGYTICAQVPLQVYRCMCGRTIPCPYRQMVRHTENSEDDEKTQPNPIPTNAKESKGGNTENIHIKSDDKQADNKIEKLPVYSSENSKPPNDRKAKKDTPNLEEKSTTEMKARDKNITETVSSRKAKSETQLPDRSTKYPKDIKRDSSVKASNQQKTAAPNVIKDKTNINNSTKNNKMQLEKTDKKETAKNKPNVIQPTNKAFAKEKTDKEETVKNIQNKTSPTTKAAAKGSTKLETKPSASSAKPTTTSTEPEPAQSKAQPKRKDHIHDAEDLPHLDSQNVNISGSCDVMVVTKRTHLYKSNGAEKIEEKRLVITKPTAAELASGSGIQLPESDADVIKRCKRIGDKLCKITITKENRAKKLGSEEKS